MLAFIITAGDVRESCLCMSNSGSGKDSPRRIVPGQSSGNAAHAPGAAEIQTIEVDQFWIGAIGDDRRLQERLGLIGRDARKKAMEPARELRFIHYAPHQISLHQRR